MEASNNKKVAIIGGGIAGLSSTFYLQKHIRENNLPIDTVLIEAANRLGGKVQTYKKDGFTIERGPDSYLARKESMTRLIKEVGMEDKLVRNATGKSYIMVKGKLHTMPQGSFMGIPTQVRPFLFSSLFSWPGKFRAAGDFVLPKSKQEGDQSLGHFFRRRLGDEVVENLIEPLLSGIYAGDIDEMSLMATFPNFYHLEQKYGSMVRGLQKSMPKPKNSQAPRKKQGMFQTLTGGLESLVEAVEARLDPGSVLKETKVEDISKTESGYEMRLSSGDVISADAIVIATPHFATQKMLSQYSFFEPFKKVPATSVANVAIAFPESAIQKDIEGTGFVVSRNSDFRITAITWTHKKWPHSAPEGNALLRCYVGKPSDQQIVEESDEVILKTVLEDLNKTMNITADPEFHVISRWKNAMPQYTVGHKERMAKITSEMSKELPGVYLAGGSYEGLGLPDCIDQGEAAVAKVLDYLNVK